jgi:hypothetical protein
MEKLNDKSNDELRQLLKTLEIEHTGIRSEIQMKINALEKVENDFEKIKRILKNRLNL